MSGEQEILYELSKTLKQISEKAMEPFSGIGMIVYNDSFDYDEHCLGMKPSKKCPEGKYLGNPDTVKYLLEMSEPNSPLHDGFTLFNGPELTHISQWFSPPKVKTVKADERYGSRFHTALNGAYLKGVDAIGTASSEGAYYLFHKLPEGNGVKIMDIEEILKCVEVFEQKAREKLRIPFEVPYLKQVAVLLILAHILKNPFVAPQIDHAKMAFGI